MTASLRRAGLLAACGLLGFTAPLPSAHAADQPRVIVGFTYVTGDTLTKSGVGAPAGLTDNVAAGDTITFTNLDPVPHTVTSSTPGLFDTGHIATGGSATIGPLAPGTYHYYCAIHTAALMSGTIVVS